MRISTNSFDGWIRSIDAYAGHDLEYLNPKGIIPQTAVIKRGEFRNNPFREKKRYDATSFPVGGDAAVAGSLEEEESSEDEEAHLPLDKEGLADNERGHRVGLKNDVPGHIECKIIDNDNEKCSELMKHSRGKQQARQGQAERLCHGGTKLCQVSDAHGRRC